MRFPLLIGNPKKKASTLERLLAEKKRGPLRSKEGKGEGYLSVRGNLTGRKVAGVFTGRGNGSENDPGREKGKKRESPAQKRKRSLNVEKNWTSAPHKPKKKEGILAARAKAPQQHGGGGRGSLQCVQDEEKGEDLGWADLPGGKKKKKEKGRMICSQEKKIKLPFLFRGGEKKNRSRR